MNTLLIVLIFNIYIYIYFVCCNNMKSWISVWTVSENHSSQSWCRKNKKLKPKEKQKQRKEKENAIFCEQFGCWILYNFNFYSYIKYVNYRWWFLFNIWIIITIYIYKYIYQYFVKKTVPQTNFIVLSEFT